MSLAKPLGPEEEEGEVLFTESTLNLPLQTRASPATHLGIYEKDVEILGFRVKHEDTIAALTKGHADTLSHLTTEFQTKLHVQSSRHETEIRCLEEMLQMELDDRLDSAFRSLDSSWAKQKALITHEYSSLIEALRSENDKAKAQLEDDRTALEKREKAVAIREQEVRSSKKVLTKNVQKRRSELDKSRRELLKLQSILSLVSEYQADCLYHAQWEASQYYEDAQEQAQVAISLAQQEAKSIVEAAQAQAEEIVVQGRASTEELITNAARHNAGLALEGLRRSPTLSDASTSAYSLRSFESLPILEESPTEGIKQNDRSRTPSSLSRRASFDATKKKRAAATRRKPIPFGNGLPTEFGLESVNPQEVPGFSRGQRRRTTSAPLSDSTRIPHRRRDGSGDPQDKSKLWKPY